MDDLKGWQDPVFKGCTRPAMLWGVPIVPLGIVGMVVVLVSVWTNIFLVITLIPIFFTMRLIAQHDDQQFRFLGLRFLFRFVNGSKNSRFWHASTYAPIRFEKRRH